MSREFVLGTAQHFNWFQLGAAIKHPEKGKRIDVSEEITKEFGIPDPEVIIQPNDGYGDPSIVRDLISEMKIDAILHYTDPRFWIWLYQMEHEIRQNIPIMFYAIWDNLPYPMYNAQYYNSCDSIFGISKQTVNIVEHTVGPEKIKKK